MKTSLSAALTLMASCVALSCAGLPGAAAAETSPPPAQFRVFAIGRLEAIALADGALQAPNDGKSFIVGHGREEVAAILKSAGAPTDHFDLSIQPLFVRSGGRGLLFDTGAGANFGVVAGALPASMHAAGVDPASVTDIFISHVHGDHVGGLVGPGGALAFPHAVVHISAPEWAYLRGMDAATAKLVGIAHEDAFVKTLQPKVRPFAPGAELIPGVVRAEEIKGHTPGHSGFLIESDGQTLLYLGDTLHSYVVSVREPQWRTAFDQDPETAAASRASFVMRAAADGQRLYAVHFPFPGIGKIEQRNGAYQWVPE